MRRISLDEITWYYINLPHRDDRRTHIAAQLARAGIRATRFDAYTKQDYTGPAADVSMMQATPNTIGNWLSHTEIIRKAARTDGVVGLLEDDALLCSDFRERFSIIEREMCLEWDIFFLGGTFHAHDPQWHKDTIGRDFELTEIPNIVRLFGAFSNQGYLINGSSAEKILEMMAEVMPQSRGSDHALIQIQPQLQCYGFVPGMVFQIDGPSDIGQGTTVFSHFLESLGPHAWKDTMAELDYYAWAEDFR